MLYYLRLLLASVAVVATLSLPTVAQAQAFDHAVDDLYKKQIIRNEELLTLKLQKLYAKMYGNPSYQPGVAGYYQPPAPQQYYGPDYAGFTTPQYQQQPQYTPNYGTQSNFSNYTTPQSGYGGVPPPIQFMPAGGGQPMQWVPSQPGYLIIPIGGN